ncbi:MAG: SDR family NAD(P)-dependent oxidoreductase [Oscillospiraceae bacterium]|nr:SDR family NAD(P)-dependent oxidoreductase [Oscillospiraceae bacterium]
MNDRKRALITGATSGIGLQMAIYLYRNGWTLTITGRNETILKRMAERFGRDTRYLALDLAQPGAAEQLFDFCKDTRIDFLINNAGFGVFGDFTETSLTQELELIQVNIIALHTLTKLFLREFVKRDSGYILNVASSAGFMAGPKLSSYYASKNYVVRLSTAIREELRRRHSHVTISVLCPGPVDTNFNSRAGVNFSMQPASAKYIAQYGIEGALTGKGILIPTLFMKLGVMGAKLCPEELVSRVVYELQKRKEII